MTNSKESAPQEPTYRSGAVARLTGIPVQTLRVWERRYKVVGPRQSATGQRLYSPAEVARLGVIKQLVESGHAIGSIAALSFEQLQPMLDKVSRSPSTLPRPSGQVAVQAELPVRAAIVGEALVLRLERQRWPALEVVATSPNAVRAREALRGVAADALIIALPSLQPDTLQTIRALRQQLGARRIVVEYGFGTQHIEQELRAAGCILLHAPMEIEHLASLLSAPPTGMRADEPATQMAISASAPRRFDNRALAEISMASVRLKCECPHHLSELLVRLGDFETYSAECENSSPADTALHHYLKEVAGNARAMLEVALVRVAEAEGLPLPGQTA